MAQCKFCKVVADVKKELADHEKALAVWKRRHPEVERQRPKVDVLKIVERLEVSISESMSVTFPPAAALCYHFRVLSEGR